MKRGMAGSLQQVLVLGARTTRRAGVLIGILAVFGMGTPLAAAEPADGRAEKTLVFVGELVSIEPLPNPCDEEQKRTGTLGCIFLDALYRARYRVVQPVIGTPAGAEVTFQVADHYGFPPFASTRHALLFVAVTDDGHWLHKYQGIPMYLTTDGRWAACGEVDRRVPPARARSLGFAEPIALQASMPPETWERMLPAWEERRDLYRIKDGQVHCLKGVPLKETYGIVRRGVMKARDVTLPPWPAGP
jgi:hypothetical protein